MKNIWSRTVHRLEKFKDYGHDAIVIASAAYVFVTMYIWIEQKFNIFNYSDRINENVESVVYGLLLVSMVVNACSFLLLRYLRLLLQTSRLAAFSAGSERDGLNEALQGYQQSEQHARVLARTNAQCDKEIFNYLFLDLTSGKLSKLTAMVIALDTVRRNIDDVLDATAAMMTTITGDECAVCVQALTATGSNKRNALVTTIARDRTSSVDRSKKPLGSRVDENTSHISIFIENKDIFIEENISESIKNGTFKTSSTAWNRFYNSIMIAAIPPIDMFSEVNMPVATLCVDNRKGRFANAICKHIVSEQAWRLSVMLYRLYILNREYEMQKNILNTI